MKEFIFILFSLFLFSQSSQSQMFVNYGIENGLEAKYIYDISQNEQLNLILATEKGLFKFDGFSFIEVELQSSNPRSYFSKLFRDKKGKLYVGNSIGEVWRESSFGYEKINLPDISNSQVINFYQDQDEFIWICTKTSGIFKYDPRLNESISYLNELHDFIINSFEGVTRKTFLIGTNEGLLICQETLNKELNIIESVEIIPNVKITYVQKQDNYWWVGTNDQGLYRITLEDKDEISFKVADDFKELELNTFSIRSATLKDGAAYIATASNGLLKIINGQVIKYRVNENLASNNLYCIYSDHEQNLWIGTFGKGLTRKVSSPFVPFNEENRILQNINDFNFYKDKLFLSTDSALFIYKKINGNWDLIQEFEEQVINALCLDDELIYFSKPGIGVYVTDYSFNNIKQINNYEDVNHLMINNDKLYISTSTLGIVILNLKNQTSKIYNTNNGLTHNEVLNSFLDKNATLWLAMSGGVLNSIQNNEVQIYGTELGLHPFDFTSFTQDNKGNVWIASDGGGIYKYDGKSFENFTRNNGLHSNYILSISSYQDNILAGDKDALSLLNLNQEAKINYRSTKEDLYDFSVNTNGLVCKHDLIWMATDKGLFNYKFKTEPQKSTPSAATYFTKILINDSVYEYADLIELPFGSYRVELNYRISCLDNPDEVKYKFYVQGLETEFGRAFNESSCYYPGIGPGEYTFNVISSGCDGVWEKTPLQLRLNIDKPFYQKGGFIAFSSLAIMGLIFLFIQYRERANKKIQDYLSNQLNIRTAEVRKQKDELAIKNKEIQDSIVYAERIQKSMLSNEQILKQNANDYFIFYRPRDIVSGDFYWFHNTDRHFFFAGADCTGHGVPGSMMSMICISELDKEINLNEKIDPAQILKDIDISVRQTLHKNEQEQTNDGMDIALCVFDKTLNTVRFAGASRPCYVFQNSELTEYKGTRAHIGGSEREDKEFELHEIQLNGKTRFYLTSDGFVDQFGGEKGKKFMRKNFRNLMTTSQDQKMSDQQITFLEAFTSWKGPLEQVDDVLVLGIEL